MIPSVLRAGSAYEWTEKVSGYAPGTYTLEYILFNAGQTLTIAGEANEFKVDLATSDTEGWAPGKYQYILRITDGTDKIDVRRGSVEILANVDNLQALDGRTHSRRMLDAIEATLEGRASNDAQEMTVRGRSIKLTPIPELLRLRGIYSAAVKSEEAAEKGQAGTNRIVRTRFIGG